MADGRVTGFWHAGVTVKDMDEALRFYRDTLGLEIELEYEIKGDYAGPIVGLDPESMLVVFLTVPNSEAKIELFEYRGIERHSASARPCDYGAGHFCLYVDDLDSIHERLVEAGFTARGPVISIDRGPRTGAKVVYTIDPDGYHVELYQLPDASAGGAPG